MEGWGFIMDVGIATVVAVLLGAVLSFIFNALADRKGWKEVKKNIGDTSRGSLSIQHEDIKEIIKDKTSNIYTKVDNIDKITIKNEALYENLNQDQKEVRKNVSRLVHDWERAISQNKELKLNNEKLLEKVSCLEENKFESQIETKEIQDKIEELIDTNKIVLEENQELKNKIKELQDENDNLYSRLNDLNYANEEDLEDEQER